MLMKNLVVVGVVVGFAHFMMGTKSWAQSGGFNVYGDGKYGYAGCGLGSLLFGPKQGPIQILAATVNGTFASQTFGITFGTSNCGEGILKAEQESFVTTNLASLQKESAQGGGDTLVAYATVLGCPMSLVDTFEGTIQQQHATVFADADASKVLAATGNLIHGNQKLAGHCSKI